MLASIVTNSQFHNHKLGSLFLYKGKWAAFGMHGKHIKWLFIWAW